jgi:hypothetical protein
MASTYSPILRIELMATGEQSGTWGNITNVNLGTLIEQAIAGTATVDVTAGNVTLTNLDGTTDQARCAAIRVIGTPGVSRNIVAPTVSKLYVIANGSNAAVVLKTSASTGLAVPVGEVYLAYYDTTSTDFRLVGRSAATTNTANTVVLRDASGNFAAGTITASLTGNVTGNLTGNADTVTNGVYTTGNQTIGGTKTFSNTISGSIDGNAATATTATSATTATTATTATNQSGGTVNATTGAFSGVASFAAGSAAAPSIARTGDTNTGIFFPFSDTISFAEGGVERMRIDNVGRVGIGTEFPDGLLTVNGVASFGDGSAGAPSVTNFGDLNTGMFFPAADTIAFSEGGTEAMRINSLGNVGIGTSFPSYRLDVAGDARIKHPSDTTFFNVESDTAQFTIITSDSQYAVITPGGTGLGIGITYGSGVTVFENSSGNMGVGTTSPSSKLQVAGQISGLFTNVGTNTAAQDLASNHVSQVTISANTTLTTTVPPAGTQAIVIIVTSGTTSRTVTFGTGFAATGTLATGTVDARRFIVSFVSDGTRLIEASRTVAIAV